MLRPNGYTKGNPRGPNRYNRKNLYLGVSLVIVLLIVYALVSLKPHEGYSWDANTVYNTNKSVSKEIVPEEIIEDDLRVSYDKAMIKTYKNKLYKYFLSAAAISRGDLHILREWVAHYLREGVEHFYLADNVTEDNKIYIYMVYDYIKKGIIDYYRKVGEFTQYEYYNHFVLPEAQRTSKWLLIIDTDEFAFAP